MTKQVLSASFTNPNGHLTPCCPQSPALYYNDQDLTVLWGWSPQTRAWVQFAVVVQAIFQGVGAPAIIPTNPAMPALYVDLITKISYTWNVVSQTWI